MRNFVAHPEAGSTEQLHRNVAPKPGSLNGEANEGEKLLVGLVALVVVGGGTAQARDDGRYANSPLKPWFESLGSKSGGKCCANADGIGLSDVDWDAKDGHYRVHLKGEWVDVPDDTVIKQPNLTGRTIVWPHYLNGHPIIRCFMPGL